MKFGRTLRSRLLGLGAVAAVALGAGTAMAASASASVSSNPSKSQLCAANNSTYSSFGVILGDAETLTVHPGHCEAIPSFRPIEIYGKGPLRQAHICTWTAAGAIITVGSLGPHKFRGCI